MLYTESNQKNLLVISLFSLSFALSGTEILNYQWAEFKSDVEYVDENSV